MADRPTISVVIATLDRPDLLSRCLDALGSGSDRPEEVVVVNQGDPVEVEAAVARARSGGLMVSVVHDDGRGLSRSQNLGVWAATGEIVAIVDDDCVPDRRWVATARAAFHGEPELVLETGPILSLPPSGDRTEAVSNRTSQRREEHRHPVVPWVVGSGGNFAIRRDRYLAVSGNDERLGTGSAGRAGNDIDLFHRVLRAGGRARYEPELLVLHERATVEERRHRRWTYGYGIGACVGRWWRDGERWALHALLAWLRLRATELARRRSLAGLRDEARVVAGTAAGLRYGLRQRAPWSSP